MNRLTVRGFNFTGDYVGSHLQRFALAEALNKLQKYEDAEEDHRLWEAPCAMGDTIYMIVTKQPKITLPEYSFIKTTHLTENNFFRVLREFGKTVFLTKQEAQARMEEKDIVKRTFGRSNDMLRKLHNGEITEAEHDAYVAEKVGSILNRQGEHDD